MAKEFARQGHEVMILIHNHGYNYNAFAEKHNLIIKDYVKGKCKEIPRDKNALLKYFGKALNYLFLYPNILLMPLLSRILKNENGFDLLISVAFPYPVHWGVAHAIQKNKLLTKSWIADCGDPFMGDKQSKFKPPFYFRLVENWFCKKPDFITVPVPEAINAYPYFCRHKIKVIPQGFNFEEVKITPLENKNPFPVFAYAGSLIKGVRDPSQFLDFLSTQDKNFKFIIYTQSVSVVAPYLDKLGDKLEIRNFIPRDQLLSELGQVDFLINIENRENVQSPSKLIDYALTQKPILSIKHNALNESIILEFLNNNYKNKLVIDGIEQYNIKNVVDKFIELTYLSSPKK
ncbi:MAG TPA: hypothetical protein VIK14_16975 [Ignavibacteria bacterium]